MSVWGKRKKRVLGQVRGDLAYQYLLKADAKVFLFFEERERPAEEFSVLSRR